MLRDPGSVIFLTIDPESGLEKFGSGIRHKYPDPQHWLFSSLNDESMLTLRYFSLRILSTSKKLSNLPKFSQYLPSVSWYEFAS
jgi:hypothetical protein